jgi:hypothetical protein
MKTNLLIILMSFYLTSLFAQNSEYEILSSAKNFYDKGVENNKAEYFYKSIDFYNKSILKFPNSENALASYLQIAKIYDENLNENTNAILTYYKIYIRFQNTREAKQSLFLIAFIYDDKMNDIINAIQSYRNFLNKYPEDEYSNEKLSETAKVSLIILESGKTFRDLIKNIK